MARILVLLTARHWRSRLSRHLPAYLNSMCLDYISQTESSRVRASTESHFARAASQSSNLWRLLTDESAQSHRSPTSFATTSSASPSPPTTWPPSHATSATTAHPSPGTPNNAATSEPASTPSTSSSTASTRDDASYILSTFPIIQRQDEAEFDGRYRTKDLILAYMNALTAGDTESLISA